ncbi:MAG: hypothetical protein APR54_04545 [Candidatus Cloacimonas sp. SDB]|nr:MAG: hypothetical protein APR54_04545 [Candidatus Cloacimonas sp. SDB]
MKNRALLILFIITIFSFLFSQEKTADSFDQEKFINAFKRVVESSGNYFSEIITDQEIETAYGPENIVNVNFPAAGQTTYFYEEYYDYVMYYGINNVLVYYFEGNDAAQAEDVFSKIKNALHYCSRNEILGPWTLEENSSTEAGVTDTNITLTSEKYPDLYITLSGRFGDSGQNIELLFELEEW